MAIFFHETAGKVGLYRGCSIRGFSKGTSLYSSSYCLNRVPVQAFA